MSRPVATTFEERQRQIVRDIASLKRMGRYVPPPSSGTVAERDAYYGIPTTQAQREALAGSYWTDTSLGLTFRYYASATVDTGVPLNLRAAVAGWYPADIRMPYALVSKTAAQTIATVTPTLVTLGGASHGGYDPFGMWSAANPSRVTVPFTGMWRVNYKVRISGLIGMLIVLRRDGIAYGRGDAAQVGTTGAATTVNSTLPVYAAAGSYLELWATMAAATSTTFVASGPTFIELEYMGPVYT